MLLCHPPHAAVSPAPHPTPLLLLHAAVSLSLLHLLLPHAVSFFERVACVMFVCCCAVVSTSASGATWRTSAAAFTGREREGEDLPQWVCDAVIRGMLPYVKELKAAFVLHPAEGSSLPSLLQSRLNAPRILQVAKVGVNGRETCHSGYTTQSFVGGCCRT